MKLTAKLVMAILVGIITLITCDAVFSVRRAVNLFETDMRSDAEAIVRVMRPVVEDEWATNGLERSRRIIEDANREDQALHFRWVWLDASAGDPFRPQLLPARIEPACRGLDQTIRGRGFDGREYLFTYAPLVGPGERPAALELAESVASMDAIARSIRNRAFALAAISVVLGVGVVASLGILIVGRPLDAIVAKIRRVAGGDLEKPLEVRGHDELAELATSVNSMCDDLAEARERLLRETIERIKAVEQLRHADRLATVGTLASGIAHELGTPLNVVAGRAGLIAKGSLPAEDVLKSCEVIRTQTNRMTTIIRQLLDFARRQTPAMSMIDVRAPLSESVELMRPIARTNGVEIAFSPVAEPPPVWVDAGQLQQVLTNLIMNAIQAMPSGGRITLGLATTHAKPPKGHDGLEGQYLRIDVKDEGEGIGDEQLRHIFDPFFTTKDVGQGTGLGLSIAYGIVSDHGGWIDVRSRRGEGTCVSVLLPLENAPCPVES